MQSLGTGDSFDCAYFATGNLNAKHQTRVHKSSIQQYIAGTAVSVVAALFGPRQSQFVTEHFKQALMRLAKEFGIVAVDRRLNVHPLRHGWLLLNSFSLAR